MSFTTILYLLLTLVGGVIVWWLLSQICLQVLKRQNSQDVPMPGREEFHAAFEQAVHWLANNEKRMYVHNTFLWIFAREAAYVSGNEKLLEIVEKYRQMRVQQGGNRDLWYLIENPGSEFDFDRERIESSSHYGEAMVYGLTGNKVLEGSNIIQSQLDPAFSHEETAKDIRSACLTHHALGLHYIQTGGYCGDPEQYEPLMSNLQAQMRDLLVRDPRVGDAYLQRVLMMVWTGARDRVKPIWFRRVLERQCSDGGWMQYHNLGPLVPGFRLGMGLHFIRPKPDKTTWHATVQGLFISALMIADQEVTSVTVKNRA